METVIISACLAGEKTRYDGRGKYNPLVKEINEKYNLLLICPEVLGGLSIPRDKAEIDGDEVRTIKGKNVTKNYENGVFKALIPIKYKNINKAILVDKSPACGVHEIYDGTFTNKLIKGKGLLTKKLESIGVTCYTIEEFYNEFIKKHD